MKLQIPTSKLQRSTKLKAPNQRTNAALVLGVWIFSGAWMLVLGAYTVLVLGAFLVTNL
jgi:hypothetical protein